KVYEEYISSHPGEAAGAKAYVAIANIWKREAEAVGSYLSIGDADKSKWKDGMDKAIENAEAAIRKFPESDSVSAALQVLLGIKQLQQAVGIYKPDDVKAYFINLAKGFEGKST